MQYRDLDAHLLNPKRFVTLAHLAQVEWADYPALQQSTGLSTPDLSKVIRDLEHRGLVRVSKERQQRYGRTVVQLSYEGGRKFRALHRSLSQAAHEVNEPQT